MAGSEQREDAGEGPTDDFAYFGLKGRVALVTGASSGLGAHFAATLARAGCHVGILARRADRLEALAEEIAQDGGAASALACDVTDPAAINAALDRLAERAGVPDILVNNAGIAPVAGFLDAGRAETEAVFDINQLAVWQVAQQVARRMAAAQRGGAIINIASITGLRAVAGVAAYAVSKAAVVQLTKVMALELARHKIRVNALAPGYFRTDLNADFLDSEAGQKLIRRVPMRRTGEPDDLNGPLLLLASPRGAYITGTVLAVDGGHLVTGL